LNKAIQPDLEHNLKNKNPDQYLRSEYSQSNHNRRVKFFIDLFFILK